VVGREVLSFDIKVNPKDSTITGSNTIKYQVVQEYNHANRSAKSFEIYKVIQDGVELNIIEKGMSLLSCASKPGV
jgi:hypothetical protein